MEVWGLCGVCWSVVLYHRGSMVFVEESVGVWGLCNPAVGSLGCRN